MSLYPSTVCTAHSSQRDRQATSGERPVEGRPPFSLVSPCSLRLSSHPERGSGEVGVVGQTGPAVRPQTSECVYVGGREGGRDPQALLQTRLHTGPHKQLLHSQQQPLSSSRNTAGFIL